MEIERKFLLDQAPEGITATVTPTQISQGYLVCEQDSELRIRKRDNRYTLTQKSGNGLVREENETDITAEAFAIMWPFTDSRQLTKKRYTFDYQGQECELDVYEGRLSGLVVLEAEFDSEEAARNFIPPDYCTRDITEDKAFKNATLARLGTEAIDAYAS